MASSSSFFLPHLFHDPELGHEGPTDTLYGDFHRICPGIMGFYSLPIPPQQSTPFPGGISLEVVYIFLPENFRIFNIKLIRNLPFWGLFCF